ncbi:chitinase-3-like protein 1 [Frankliniella occidentalis]|uniref:chitinase n=1 Tax=Frankliniella occidentalis TaxID=133901 RepID=A0A9C6XC57_FRAOC|nr:chitinase-3-like protein 1 [Frankliniella occidentalis]
MAWARQALQALALLVLVLGPCAGRSLSARERAALTAAGFLRDSVESVPAHVVPGDGERGAHRASLKSSIAPFGTQALPIRAAVEHRPSSRDRALESIPLRSAVERRPAPDPAVAPPPSRRASRPVVHRTSPRVGVRPLTSSQAWPANSAHPFLGAVGANWWQQSASALPSPSYVIPLSDPSPSPVATRWTPQTPIWPYLETIPNYAPAGPLLQPQGRWGLLGSPNYVFSTLGERQPPLVLTYQAIKNPEPEQKVVCYLEAWAAYRKDVVSYSADNVDPFACTHLLYAFASIDPHSFRIVPQDEEYDLVKGGYRAAVGVKRKNPKLKVMLSVGGWMEGSSKFSQMASRADRRREFIRSVVRVLDAHKFDGLDLDWEYPGALDLGGLSSDKDHFSLLVDELAEVFGPRGWLLSAAVSPSRFRMEDAYDVARIAKSLDFINLMAFDLHAERDSAADHHAPLHQRPHDASIDIFYNVDYAVKYWMKRGAPAEKLVLGVPFYGRSFTLKDPARYVPGSAIKGLGKEGRYTQEKGFLAYFEICELQAEGGWRLQVDRAGSPFMVKGDQWVGYEDAVSVTNKMAYIRKQNLGGVMIWAVDLDDFHGQCGTKTPLLSAVRNNIQGESVQ